MTNEVIKREVTEGDKAEEARKKITRATSKALRAAASQRATSNKETEAMPAVE